MSKKNRSTKTNTVDAIAELANVPAPASSEASFEPNAEADGYEPTELAPLGPEDVNPAEEQVESTEPMTLQEARNEETAIVVAEAAAKTKGKRGKRELDLNDPFMKQSIKLLRKENPKRKGSKSAARFNLYVDGMTVLQFIQAGGTRGDINWDTQHEHIELQPAPKAAAAE